MADKSGIEWTDATWNPIVGCSIVSTGCTNCYAMKMAARIEAMNPGNHYAGTTKASKGGAVWTGKIALAPEHILTAPLRWKRGRKIFVNSMGDLFHEEAPLDWIVRVFAVMAISQHHVFQVLTKRSARMREIIAQLAKSIEPIEYAAREMGYTLKFDGKGLVPWPLPNVWLGVSTEDQKRADERIMDLLQTPAAVRFISAEPLLGPIDLNRIAFPDGDQRNKRDALIGQARLYATGIDGHPDLTVLTKLKNPMSRIDWVIVGGESGPGARSMHVDYAQSIVDQCRAADVAVFMKQLGSKPIRAGSDKPFKVTGAGGEMQEWAGSLRYRQFPNPLRVQQHH